MVGTMLRPPIILVASALVAPAAFAQTPLAVDGVPEGAPFTASASATPRVLIVDLTFEPEWHAYARDVGGGQPVAVEVSDDSAFAADGALVTPEAPDGKLEGEVRLRLPLEALEDGVALSIDATLALQVCDALECLAPMELRITGEVEVLSVLLVSPMKEERADRLAVWLKSRGFEVVPTTYATATPELCEAADVVLADSGLFRSNGDALGHARQFPRTETPIVAVGFLGTELVEAHDVAMTSGYI